MRTKTSLNAWIVTIQILLPVWGDTVMAALDNPMDPTEYKLLSRRLNHYSDVMSATQPPLHRSSKPSCLIAERANFPQTDFKTPDSHIYNDFVQNSHSSIYISIYLMLNA